MSVIKKADVQDYFARRAAKGVLFFRSPSPTAIADLDRTNAAASAVHAENGSPVAAARAKVIPIAPAFAHVDAAATSTTSSIPRI